MDDDDDYFDMRGRIGVTIEKKHRDGEEKKEIDDSTSDSSACPSPLPTSHSYMRSV